MLLLRQGIDSLEGFPFGSKLTEKNKLTGPNFAHETMDCHMGLAGFLKQYVLPTYVFFSKNKASKIPYMDTWIYNYLKYTIQSIQCTILSPVEGSNKGESMATREGMAMMWQEKQQDAPLISHLDSWSKGGGVLQVRVGG